MTHQHPVRPSAHWTTLAVLSLFAITTIGTSAADYKSVVLSDSPAAYWRLDETAGATVRDSAASHEGTANGVLFGRAGAITNENDTAFGFDGATSSVGVPYSVDLNSAVFSIELWAKPNKAKPGHLIDSVYSSGGYVLGGYELNAFWVNWTWTFQILSSGWNLLDSSRIVTNQWTHIVETFNGSNISLYVDGVLSATKICSNYVPNTSSPLNLGASFSGDLDEVADIRSCLVGRSGGLALRGREIRHKRCALVIQEPLSQTVTVGSPAALVAFAYGDPSLLSSGTRTVATGRSNALPFTLSSASYSDNGVYSVAVENQSRGHQQPAGEADCYAAAALLQPHQQPRLASQI